MMNQPRPQLQLLRGLRVLIMEDEYFIADDVRRALVDAGSSVIGPVSTVSAAEDAIQAGDIDFAVIDLNLHGDSGLPIARRLLELEIPFAVATGYGATAVPDWLSSAPRCEKPFDPAALVQVVARWAKTTDA